MVDPRQEPGHSFVFEVAFGDGSVTEAFEHTCHSSDGADKQAGKVSGVTDNGSFDAHGVPH